MKALIFDGPHNVVPKDMPVPKPKEGELLVKPLHVALCFSEKHMYEGSFKFGHPGTPIGHEFCAEVAEVGPGVEGWKVGDRIADDYKLRCGTCNGCKAGLNCEHGLYLRTGFFAEYGVVPAYSAYRLSPKVSNVAGANLEPLAIGTRCIRHSGVTVGDNVVILGFEDYAMGILQWAKLMGLSHVVVADPIAARREVAKRMGADVVIDPTIEDPVSVVRELMPFGADCTFVSVEEYVAPSHQYVAQAVKLSRVQGTVVIARNYAGTAFQHINYLAAYLKEITIRWFGVIFGNEPWRGGRERGDFQLTLDALADGKIDGDSYTTRIIPFDEIQTKADVDAIFRSVPEDEVKVQIRIWGK